MVESPVQASRNVIDAISASRQLGVSRNLVYKLLRQGKLEGYGVGRRRVIYADSIDMFRQRNAIGSPKEEEAAPKLPKKKDRFKPLELPRKRHLRLSPYPSPQR